MLNYLHFIGFLQQLHDLFKIMLNVAMFANGLLYLHGSLLVNLQKFWPEGELFVLAILWELVDHSVIYSSSSILNGTLDYSLELIVDFSIVAGSLVSPTDLSRRC